MSDEQPKISIGVDAAMDRFMKEPKKIVLYPSGDISYMGFASGDEALGCLYRLVASDPAGLVQRLALLQNRIAEQEIREQAQKEREVGKLVMHTPDPDDPNKPSA